MPKLVAVLVLVCASVGLGAPAQAAPPNNFGNPCTATVASGDLTAVITAKSGADPLPITAPITGVITKATFALPVDAGTTYPTVLKTLRGTGAPNQFNVVAESGTIAVGGGTQGYPVRVPVQAGDQLGLSSTSMITCAASPADVVSTTPGSIGPGQSASFTQVAGYSLPVVATVEPDVDKDGFGDTTQDLCPQSAAFQTSCPAIHLDSSGAAKRRSITFSVVADSQAEVTVTGTAKASGKTIKLKGGTRLVTPGALTKFKVKLPASLRSALAALPHTKRIKVKLTATATDLAGRVSTDTSTVKVPGTA